MGVGDGTSLATVGDGVTEGDDGVTEGDDGVEVGSDAREHATIATTAVSNAKRHNVNIADIVLG